MPNQLFIICPFSCLEPVLKKKFGKSIYFLTSPLASVETADIQFLNALKCIIETEKITEIIIVNSTTCRFINGVISNSKQGHFQCVEVLQELFHKNFKTVFDGLTLNEQAYKLAELSISYYTLEILQSNILGSHILTSNIEIGGLIISENKTVFNHLKLTHKV